LARRRRARRVQDFRVDERERQRSCRKRRREAAAAAAAPGHAPASASSPAEWARELLDAWDGAVARSRAGLRRQLALILREKRPALAREAPPAM
jgi:hypothetical protein